MKRALSIAIIVWTQLVFCVLSQAGERPLPVVVGTLGDPARLAFEGITTFTDEKIRRALMMTPDFLLASHPAARFGEYLPAIKGLVETGYKHRGFPEPQVSIAFDPYHETFAVKVSEGPRYLCGDIEVLGAKTVPTELFARQMTDPRVKKTDSNQTKTESPIWPTGRPTSFSRASQEDLTLKTHVVLCELGYYFCQFSVKVVPDPGTPSARLVVQIEDEGARTINEIIISGNKKNTREEILQYLGLEEGMLLDRALILKTEDLLWHSARFLQHSVTPEVDGARATIKLRIDLREYEPVPRLSEPFSPEEEMLLKCCDWLSNFLDQEDDLTADLYVEEIDIQVQIVVSPTKGTLFIARKGDGSQGANMLNAAIVAPEEIAFFSPARKAKFVLPAVSSKIVAQLSLMPNSDPNSEFLWAIMPSIGYSNKPSGESYRLDLKLAPTYFVSYAHREGVDVSHLLNQGIVRSTDDSNLQMKIDPQSGRLIEMTYAGKKGRMTLTLDRGIFDQLGKKIKQTTADHENRFVPQSPVGSTVRYLGDLPLLHWGLFQLFGTQLDVSEEEWGRAAEAVGKVLESTALPFDKWTVKKHEGVHDSFMIPPNLGKTATTSNSELVSMVAALVFGINNELFPPGSWPWTLARETVFVASGMGKYTQMELGRTYMSPQTGPLGFLVAAKLLTYFNQPLSRAFAAKGLKALTADDFRKDWSLLVAEDHLLSQCLDHMVKALWSLDEQDLNAVLVLFSQEEASLIRDTVTRMRENETKPIRQVLAPVLEYQWHNGLKAKVEQALRAYAQSTVDAITPEKKTAPPVSPKPSVSRTAPKRPPPTRITSLPRPKKIVDSGFKGSFAPDGNRLVFGRPQGRGLCILDLETGEETSLTISGLDPAWAPDGRFIAYVERELDERSEEVWVVKPDGTSSRKLADGGYPSWSKEGNTLFVHSRKTGRILAFEINDQDAEPSVFFEKTRSWYPTISPDGQRIAFGPTDALVIVDRQTREPILKWPTPGSRGLLPAWSPDGKQVAFGGFDNERLGLWVLDVETGKAVQLTKGPCTMPAWSRDGTKLAFDMRAGSRREIWMVETRILAAMKPSRLSRTNLTRLSLIDRNIADAGLARQLEGIRALRELVLENTPITDAGLVHLKGLTSLQILLLGNTNITDAGLGHLKDLVELKRLCLHDTGITDAGLAQLRGLTSLESLCLHHTDITDAGLVHLRGLTVLEILNVNDTQVTEAAANALRRLLPNTAVNKTRLAPAISPVSSANQSKADEATAQLKALSEPLAIADITQVRTLIEAGADVNLRNKDGLTPLMMASKMGRIEVVKLLLKAKADVNARQSNGWSALFAAAAGNHVEVVRCLTENGAELNTKDTSGRALLGLAAYAGYDAIVGILLENGAEVDTRNGRTQETPLIAACQEGHVGVAKLLLEHGADVNAERRDGANALHMATWNEHADVVRILLPYNPNPNMRGPQVKTLLMWACEKNNLELFEALLQLPVDVNAKNDKGSTALIVASLVGNPDMVAKLLSRGADVHATVSESGYSGQTALMAAPMFVDFATAKRQLNASGMGEQAIQTATRALETQVFPSAKDRSRVVELLLEAGADVNQKRSDGVTSLILASQVGNIDVVNTLVNGGADVNLKANDGGTALILASASGHATIVALLLEHGADVSAKRIGSTALNEASLNGHTEVVRTLLAHGLNVNALNGAGHTALMAACAKGHIDLARALIELGANVNLADEKKGTALIFASMQGHVETVETILSKTADVNAKDSADHTALVFALKGGHLEIVELLLTYGANIPITTIDWIEPIVHRASGNEASKKRLHQKLRQTQKVWLDNDMPITPGEVKAFYDKVKDGRFEQDLKVDFSLIDVQPARLNPSLFRQDEKETRQDAAQRIAHDLKKRIAAGESFSQLAKDKNHSHGPRGFKGGLWGPISLTSLKAPWKALAVRALEMQAGEVAGPIVEEGHVFLLKLNQIHEEKGQFFQEAKGFLENELRGERRKKLEDAIHNTANVPQPGS